MRIDNRLRRFVLVIIVAAAATMLILLPQANRGLLNVLEAIQSAGPWGPLLMIVVYIAACVLFVPGSILTIGAGFIFGIPVGTVTVSIGSTLGAGAAFLLSRTLLREWVVRKLTARPRFRALDEAVGTQGFKIVLLTRLSPILPFNLLNFAFGTTKVSFHDYLLASWIGMLPGALLYVYIGTAIKSVAELAAGREESSLGERVLFGFGLAATGLVLVFLVRIARKALTDALPESPASDEQRFVKS